MPVNIDAILANLDSSLPRTVPAKLDILDLIARVQARSGALDAIEDPPDFEGKQGAWIEEIKAALPRGWRVRRDEAVVWKNDQAGARHPRYAWYLARMSFHNYAHARPVGSGHNLADILQFDLATVPADNEPYDPVPMIGPGGRRVKSWKNYRYAVIGSRSDPGRWRTYQIWVGHHVRDVLRAALDGGMQQASNGVFSAAFWPLPQGE